MVKELTCLVVLTIACTGTHAISCLSCKAGAEHLHDCSEVIQCTEGQACFVEKVMPLDGGRTKYLAGCRDISLCNIIGCSAKETKNLTDINKRSDIPVCSECCFRSLCNTQGCGGVFAGNSTSMRCFSCPVIYGNTSCNSFTLCDKQTQMCKSEVIDASKNHGHPGAVALGCGQRNKCEFTKQYYMNHSTPLEAQSIHCCDSHLCNWKPLDNTSDVESIANKLTCPPDLVERPTNAQGITEPRTAHITNTQRTTTATPPKTPTTTTTTTTQAPTTTTTTTTPALTTTSTTATPAPTTIITTTIPLPKTSYTCNFDDGQCDWRNMAEDNFDWIFNKGPTPTRANGDDTGPIADHTSGNSTGMYAYIESSAPRVHGERAWLESPLLAPSVRSGPQCLHFWYNMYGASIGSLKVYISQNNAIPGYTIWGLSGNQGEGWKQAHVPLDSHVDFHIIFEGTVGAGSPNSDYLGDIAIDDIILTTHPCSEDKTTPRTPTTSQTSTQAIKTTQPTTNAIPTQTTEAPPFQLGTDSTKCHQCTGPIQICEQIHFSKPCLYPNNYCINHITNHLDGTKTVNSTCGNFDTCYREWHIGSSDEDKCEVIKNNQHVDFQCTFCCVKNDCNVPLRPAEDSLYKPRMIG